MSIEIIGVALPFVALAWAILNWFAVEKLRKQAEADQKQAEAELSKALKNRDEALQNLEATKKKYAEFIQQLEKEDPMANTRKTNINTQRPNPPVKRQAMPSTSTHRPMQSSPVQRSHNDSPDMFRAIADMQDLSRYSSEPSTSYDSGSSYDSFGGGSSDGGGASSDW